MADIIVFGDTQAPHLGESVALPYVSKVLAAGDTITGLTSKILAVNGSDVLVGITDNSTNWNTAYSWGNHATAGYLTSYTETDPVFTASAASGIGASDITNWNTAFGWGDHASAGYFTATTDGDGNSYLANDGTYKAVVSGISIGDSVGSATDTYVPYFGAGGVLAQSANFVFSSNRLGIGTDTPLASAHILGASISGAIGKKTMLLEDVFPELQFKDTSASNGFFMTQYGNQLYMGRTTSTGTYKNYVGMIQLSSGAWVIGSGSNPLAQFDIRVQNHDSKGFRIQAANSQTANLVEIDSYTGSGGDLYHLKPDGTPNYSNMPTSSAGLSSGDLWNDSGTVKIV